MFVQDLTIANITRLRLHVMICRPNLHERPLLLRGKAGHIHPRR